MNSIAKIEGRNYALDFVRFVMAFLVVVIHVPCFGSGYLMSVARCAIPFFYIVSGYFLWKDSEEDFFYACVRNAKKWLNLFIISALILSTATIVIKTIYTQPLAYFSWEQFFWLCLNGFYPSMEKIIFEDNPYGSFNVVWFLYAGIITFLLAKYLHRFIKRFFFVIWCIILITISIIINRIYGGVLVPRLLSASIPFVLIGAWLRCHCNGFGKHFSFIKLLIADLLLIIVSTLEMKFSSDYKELVFSTALLSIALFLTALKSPFKFGFISYLPVKSTFDIYIYHRLLFLLLVIMGWNHASGLSAAVVYAVCLVMSAIIRKIMSIY